MAGWLIRRLTWGNVRLWLLACLAVLARICGDGGGVKRDPRGLLTKSLDQVTSWWQRGTMTGFIPHLSRMAPVPPREVWANEAQHFTPWLLQNADVLSDLLGMDLALEVAEHPVGGFSLDLIGKDVNTGQVVIVENQLETSDHLHLGQLLTYAAGTDPTTIVWIASAFRPEHRAALDWLNARTDEDTRFFGVQLGVVRIDNSPPAPTFKLVAEPNDWEKTVRTATNQTAPRSEKQELYRAFWAKWLERVHRDRPSWSRATRLPADSWFTTSTGTSWVSYYTAWTRQGLSSELVFESPDPDINTARLLALQARQTEVEQAYGGALDWQELPGRKATRIAEYLADADIYAQEDWDRYVDWLLERQTRLRDALAAVGGVPEPVSATASASSLQVPSRESRPGSAGLSVPGGTGAADAGGLNDGLR